MNDEHYLAEAIREALIGRDEGGIPIGSVMVLDDEIIGRGHNRRVQKGSSILHAEMDAIESAGRLTASDLCRVSLYTTLSPCAMCAGAIILYQIPRVVIGENVSFAGEEALLRERGVELTIVNNQSCIEMMKEFINNSPQLWDEDIGR